MKKQLVAKLKSNAGASFSLALLLFLFCAALSAVVIAAATASAGQYVNQGKADRAYYSALSAAELFEQSLGSEGSRTFTITQEKKGKRTVVREGDKEEPVGDITYIDDADSGNATTVAFEGASPSTTSPDFMTGVTYYAFAGAQPPLQKDDATLGASLQTLLVGKPTDTWIDPFTLGAWQTKTSDTIAFTVNKPTGLTGDPKPTGEALDALQASGDGTLSNDWTFDIVFTGGSSSGNGSTVQMTIAADIVNYDEIEPISVDKVTTEGSKETIEQTVRHVRVTEVEWHVERSVAGGASNA